MKETKVNFCSDGSVRVDEKEVRRELSMKNTDAISFAKEVINRIATRERINRIENEKFSDLIKETIKNNGTR